MEKENKKFLPDGYIQIDEVIKDITQLVNTHNGNTMLVRSLNHLVTKLNIAKEIINYSPRLPFQQIEQKLKEMCKGNEIHGAHVTFHFDSKYPNGDLSKFGYLPVYI
ncbi:MAG: hypothetical protein ABJJ05_09470 [Maribacter litoralis]|uniref:hypothetical protein n=1 Tax=Maribacter litoralis TaxID=2059726 RepID=UPI00329937C7